MSSAIIENVMRQNEGNNAQPSAAKNIPKAWLMKNQSFSGFFPSLNPQYGIEQYTDLRDKISQYPDLGLPQLSNYLLRDSYTPELSNEEPRDNQNNWYQNRFSMPTRNFLSAGNYRGVGGFNNVYRNILL